MVTLVGRREGNRLVVRTPEGNLWCIVHEEWEAEEALMEGQEIEWKRTS